MYNLSCDKYIPFDAYMGPRTFSVLHDSIFYPQAQVLIGEIQGRRFNYPKPTRTLFLSKQDPSKHYFCPGETLYFKADHYATNHIPNPTWTVTNSNYFQIVSGQGTNTVGIKYLGGMSYGEFIDYGVKITIADEGPCYKYGTNDPITMGVGDIWSGSVGYISGGGNANMPFTATPSSISTLNFLPLSNSSDRYRVKIGAGLVYKESNLQQYTLLQNTSGTAMTWGVYPYTMRGYTQNYINIFSNLGGQYQYKVTDANRCAVNQENYFYIGFSFRQLYWRVSPNPAKDELQITKDEESTEADELKPKNVTFVVIDIHTKQTLYKTNIPNAESFKIPVYNLKDGEYVLQIVYGDKSYTEKFWVRK